MSEFPRIVTPVSNLTEFFENSKIWGDILKVVETQIQSLHIDMDRTDELMLDYDGINDARGRIAQLRGFVDMGIFIIGLKEDQQEKEENQDE